MHFPSVILVYHPLILYFTSVALAPSECLSSLCCPRHFWKALPGVPFLLIYISDDFISLALNLISLSRNLGNSPALPLLQFLCHANLKVLPQSTCPVIGHWPFTDQSNLNWKQEPSVFRHAESQFGVCWGD